MAQGRKPGFKHSEKTREKIKTSQLVNRLQAYIMGEPDPKTGEPVEMKPAQVNAAKVLLDKTLPSLSMADIQQTTTDQVDPVQRYIKLVEAIGEVDAARLFPDMAKRIEH